MIADVTIAGPAQRLPIFWGLGPLGVLSLATWCSGGLLRQTPHRSVVSDSLVGVRRGRDAGMAKRGTHARQHSPVIVLGIFVLIGFLFVAASISADGTDFRPVGGDAASLAQDRSDRIKERREDAKGLRAEIDRLSASVS